MVYVPKAFVPGGQEQQFTASAPSSSQYPAHHQQQQQAYYQQQSSASSYPAQQQQYNTPSFSQALNNPPPPPTHLQPARPSAPPAAYSSSMPPIVQGSYVSKIADEVKKAAGGYSSSMPPSSSTVPYYNTQQQQQQQQQQYPPPSYAPNASYSGGYYPTTASGQYGNNSSSGYNSGGNNNNNNSGGMISQGNPSHCQKVDYEIIGNDMQLVEIELDPNETIVAEAGAMTYMEDGIEFTTKFGDGSTPNQGFFSKLMAAGGRILTGESLFLTHFTNTKGNNGNTYGSGGYGGNNNGNNNNNKARVAFAAPYPGTIMPIDMGTLDGQTLICQKDAFLCAAKGTKLSLYFNKRIGSGLFGGEGFLLQKLQGDGMAFIHAGGTVIEKELHGERLRVDTGCLVAFTNGITFDIQMAPGLKTMIFGGEGIFLATLQGHGTVWIQSLPFSRMADRIVRAAPSIGGKQQDEGTALLPGKLGSMISGEGLGGAFKIPGI